MRDDGRQPNEMRPVTIETGFQSGPDGSALVTCGNTKVICSAYATQGVPGFLAGSGKGWVTAEYAMLPGASPTRTRRERKTSGRSSEIQRLVGRSMRAIVDLEAMADQTINLDCDVLQADGGTRTASITGAFVAMVLAAERLRSMGLISQLPFTDTVSAISCGIIEEEPRLDLHYNEDFRAEVDMNVVLTGKGNLVEVQGTAEGAPFSRAELNELVDLAEIGCKQLAEIQRNALGALYDEITAGNGK